MNRLLYTLAFLLVNTFLFGQDTILLQNPSFEDTPRTGKAPAGWYNCGFAGESEPDVQPSSDVINQPFFSVRQSPSHGYTYIGMVTRDNDTWETIGQKLSTSIKADKYYKLTVDLCRSGLYESLSRRLDVIVNYTSPTKLRIWAGDAFCQKKELLVETPLIVNTDWEKHPLVLQPKNDYDFIIFECFYKTPTKFPYNGNL